MARPTLEIADIAAEVSWELLAFRSGHAVYDKVDDGFLVVGIKPGTASPHNAFGQCPKTWTDEDRRNAFWKLERDSNCNTNVAILVAACKHLMDRGVVLVHEKVPVTNLFAVNGYFDTSALEDITLSVVDKEHTGSTFKLGLYSTVPNQETLASFPPHICAMLGRQAPENNDNQSHRLLADYLGIPADKLVHHWWACFALENRTMLHIDLCGPAYNLFTYRKRVTITTGSNTPLDEAPVYLVTSPALSLLPLHPSVAQKYPYKFQMSRYVEGDSSRMVRLPPEFLPFSNEKVDCWVTPFDVILARHSDELSSFAACMALLVDNLLLHAMHLVFCGSSAMLCGEGHLVVEVQGIVKKPELNGKRLRAMGVTNGRVIVALDSCAQKITVSPSKLSVVSSSGSKVQGLTLSEMKSKLEMETERYVQLQLFPGDVVRFENLSGSTHLNGMDGIVVEEDDKNADPDYTRYIVELMNTKGERNIVKRKNLKLIKRCAPDSAEEERKRQIMDFLLKDPHGSRFYQRTLAVGNMGMTNLTDPELLPVFETIVGMRAGEVLLKSPPQQRQWEALLKLTKRPQWNEFRTMVQNMRSGMTHEDLEATLASDDGLKEMLEICTAEEILKARPRNT